MRSVVESLKWVLVAGGLGCQNIENDSFPLTLTEAARALDEMETTPKRLKRPLVVATGYLDPGVGSERLANVLRRGLQDDRVIAVDFFWCARFDECRDHLIRTVDEAFPTKDPLETTEVDVVAISMAGLVAGYASQDFPEKGPASPGRRLLIKRLFTIGAPLRGARMAEMPSLVPLQLNMRRNSCFVQTTAAAISNASYELYCYTRLGDWVVGSENTSPPGQTPWWVSTPSFELSHLGATRDARIHADILRRLRGESGYATHPPAPLP